MIEMQNPYNVASPTGATAFIVKPAPGRIWGLVAFSVVTQARYLQIWNQTTVPAVGASNWEIPLLVRNNDTAQLQNTVYGYYFQNGIVVTISTDPQVYTPATLGDVRWSVSVT